MASVLKEPRKKCNSKQRAGNPLPVLVESETGVPAYLASWKACSGRFNGDCVEVNDTEDISTLFNRGFFGKGALSRGCPRSIWKNAPTEIIRDRQWKRRHDWSACQNSETEEQNNVSEASKIGRNEKEVVVIADKDVEGEDIISELSPRIEKDCSPLPEALHLLLEEAFFLCYALGCLYVFDIEEKRILNISEFFSLCLESDARFLQRYIGYHHFRSKGWVVKSGLKFGGDFLLYKEGPTFYHASYVVLTRVLHGENSVESNELKEEKMDWITLMGLNRLAETSGKEVLICNVIWPSGALPHQSLSPKIIKKFKVHDVLMHRWQSSVARIGSNDLQTNVE